MTQMINDDDAPLSHLILNDYSILMFYLLAYLFNALSQSLVKVTLQ